MITVVHSYAVPAEFLGFEIDEGAMPSTPSIELGIADQLEDVVSDSQPFQRKDQRNLLLLEMAMSCHHLRESSLNPQMVQLSLKVSVLVKIAFSR